MGTTSSTQIVETTNQMILNAMVVSNMGCNSSMSATQVADNCGFSLFEFQKQKNLITQSCQMSNEATTKIQQSLIESLSQQLETDSKFYIPATTQSYTKDVITNTVNMNLTQENIASINTAIFASQNWTNCGVSIVAIQEQYNKIALKAISDVMSKTSLYQDLNNAMSLSDKTTATFIGLGGMFLIMIFLIFALYFASSVLSDPEAGKNTVKIAALI